MTYKRRVLGVRCVHLEIIITLSQYLDVTTITDFSQPGKMTLLISRLSLSEKLSFFFLLLFY